MSEAAEKKGQTVIDEGVEKGAARLTAERIGAVIERVIRQESGARLKTYVDTCVHCGLCAERCPTAAWDMMQFDLLHPYAGQEPWPTTAATASTTSA